MRILLISDPDDAYFNDEITDCLTHQTDNYVFAHELNIDKNLIDKWHGWKIDLAVINSAKSAVKYGKMLRDIFRTFSSQRMSDLYTPYPIVLLLTEPEVRPKADQELFHLMTMPFAPIEVATRVQKISRQLDVAKSVKVNLHTSFPTGFKSRYFFEETVYQWIKEEIPFTLLYCDVDDSTDQRHGLKKINNSYGHPVGDQLLEQLGATIRERIKLNDDEVGSFGGDEICIALKGCQGKDNAYLAAERIRDAVSKKSFVLKTPKVNGGNKYVNSTMSIGVTMWEPAETSLSIHEIEEEIVRQANLAMWGAKSRDKNCVVFYDEMIAKNRPMLVVHTGVDIDSAACAIFLMQYLKITIHDVHFWPANLKEIPTNCPCCGLSLEERQLYIFDHDLGVKRTGSWHSAFASMIEIFPTMIVDPRIIRWIEKIDARIFQEDADNFSILDDFRSHCCTVEEQGFEGYDFDREIIMRFGESLLRSNRFYVNVRNRAREHVKDVTLINVGEYNAAILPKKRVRQLGWILQNEVGVDIGIYKNQEFGDFFAQCYKGRRTPDFNVLRPLVPKEWYVGSDIISWGNRRSPNMADPPENFVQTPEELAKFLDTHLPRK